MEKGDQVVAVRDLGGFLREPVPKGTRGVVVDVFGGDYKVQFNISGFTGNRQVVVSVRKDEVA